MSEQITVLQHIAAFAAKVRGHQLGIWHIAEGFATAACAQCGSGLTVRCAPIQPDIHGALLSSECQTSTHRVAA